MRTSSPPVSPIESLWQARALTWIVILVLGLALVLSLAPGHELAPLSLITARFGLIALIGLWIALPTVGALYLMRRVIVRLDPVRVAWIGFAVLLAMALIVSGVTFLIARDFMYLSASATDIVLRTCVIALVVSVLSLGGFQIAWHNRQLLARARRSEQAALQARTHPHFLFNTLNTAISLVRGRPEDVEILLLNLSDLFRAAIGGAQEHELSAEIALTRQYLEIESLRFGERIDVRWTVPEPTPAMRVPTLSLQPLAENAVLHGIERRAQGGRIDIVVRIEKRWAIIEVRNPLPPSSASARVGHGIGLEAVRERVRDFTDDRGRLETGVDGDHYVATLTLPFDNV